jgi:ubiquinone biosynthesis protein
VVLVAMAPVLVALAWVVIGPVAAFFITALASRLLGVRRGWLSMAIAGVIGWTVAVVVAGLLTSWTWSSATMVLAAVALGPVLTMVAAVGLDLLAQPGSLTQGDRSGLLTVPRPFRTVRLAVAPLGRYREVARIAAANGLLPRPRQGRAIDGTEVAVRRTLEQAGGMFVKLGQVASTRNDLLPAAMCAELSKLRASVAPAAREDVQPALEHALGMPVADAFATFDWDPLASASIAQVYAAELHDGRPVVVKVQRPGIESLVDRDGAALLQIAGMVERHTLLGLTSRPRELAEEFIGDLHEELDFRVEAANADALAAVTPATWRVRIPAVHQELSSRTVLVEERFEGVSVADLAEVRRRGADPAEISTRLLRTFLGQLFDAGLFHADPHPGNVLLLDDGWLGLIDFGAVGRLGATERQAVVEMMVGVASGNVTTLRDALLSIVVVEGSASVPAIDAALRDFLARHVRPGQGITAEAFGALVTIVGELGLRVPRWFATLARAMVTLEGTLRTIDPAFSLVDGALQMAPELMPTLHAPGDLRVAVEQELAVQLPRLRRLPERVDTLLGQASAGRLSVRVALFTEPDDERVVTKLVNRVVQTVLAASLGIGSAVLIGIDAGPSITDAVSLNEVLGYAGLIGASVLGLRVVAAVVRDGVW